MWGGCIGFLSGFLRSQSLVRGLHLNAMDMATASSAQGDDKFAAPIGSQKRVKIGVGHLIRLASRGLQDLPNNSPIELSWAWQPMNVPTMKIFLQAKRPILVSLACQLGF
ncbi:unnamed protein product [Prunus armeniaca]